MNSSIFRNGVGVTAGIEPATYGSECDNDDLAAPRGKLVKVAFYVALPTELRHPLVTQASWYLRAVCLIEKR